MESTDIYKESYDNINQMIKSNMTNDITINYAKLDVCTQGELREAIHRVLYKRSHDIKNLLFRAN